ncbi:unnamed protein product [Dovyalis caffra]|uniref:Phorbol-ester/DAG-type domain-containing protein n=1 Tax=Dovyalis caffra TaxID=77055 RepID=A0AAV1RKN2_9ROSI|nr:unnamed protein product [Dovyalis caffra]
MAKSFTVSSYKEEHGPLGRIRGCGDQTKFRYSIINHFSHPHPLRYGQVIRASCIACSKYEYGEAMYLCRSKSCDYQLHPFCAQLPRQLHNPYHPHPLTLQANPGEEEKHFACTACTRKLGSQFRYYCDHCDLKLDIGCASLRCSTNKDNGLLHHFSHFHPLAPLNKVPDEQSYLRRCGNLSDRDYVCTGCNFVLPSSCLELKLPGEIQHSNHPCLLTLRIRFHFETTRYWLQNQHKPHFEYQCAKCRFIMEATSAVFLTTQSYEDQKQFHHFSHKHPLILSRQKDNDDRVNCSACGKSCSGPTYCCTTCQYFLHQHCFDLPLEIRHFFHRCPLFLCIQANSVNCGACNKIIPGFYFYCKWCNFSMDVECALSPTIEFQSREHFSHFSHPHPLMLIDIKDSDGVYCSACDKCLSGQGFVCSECSFVLHQSCFESPQEIRHRFHPFHPLILQTRPSNVSSTCNACCKYLNGFTYVCSHCNFELHIECATIMPNVSYKGHQHLLLFLENTEIEVECNSCGISCNSSVFRCVDCNFNLHYTCGPLPHTIKHECHIDPLLLRDSPVEDDTYDGFYCDECEKKRDPLLPIYHCKDCHYIAEIECVKSEVMLTLKGGYGDVELRNPAGRINGKVITNLELTEIELEKEQNSNKDVGDMEGKPLTFDDAFDYLNFDEKRELENVLAAQRRDITEAVDTSSENNSEYSDVYGDDVIEAGETSSYDYSENSGDEHLRFNDISLAFRRSICRIKKILSSDRRADSDGKLQVSQFLD